jgi:hypothetical protein
LIYCMIRKKNYIKYIKIQRKLWLKLYYHVILSCNLEREHQRASTTKDARFKLNYTLSYIAYFFRICIVSSTMSYGGPSNSAYQSKLQPKERKEKFVY